MPITNFNDITSELTDEEKQLSEVIIAQLRLRYVGPKNAINQEEIVKRMRERGYKISGPRLRKIFNYLRSNGNPIIATNSGCYYSSDPEEIRAQIESLRDRQKALEGPITGLIKYLSNINIQTIARIAS